jgi:hypothetical protein
MRPIHADGRRPALALEALRHEDALDSTKILGFAVHYYKGTGAAREASYNNPSSPCVTMDHYVAYHSVEIMGSDYSPSTDFGFYTRKPEKFVRGAIGSTAWVIVGKRVSGQMQYQLAGAYTPTDVKDEDGTWVITGPGTPLRPLMDVTSLPWFSVLKRDQNNFSFGFNRINNQDVINALMSIVPGHGNGASTTPPTPPKAPNSDKSVVVEPSTVARAHAPAKVFIANFGLENYIWPACLSRSTVATFEDEDLRPFWLAGDRDGYVDLCIKTKKTAAGITPTVPVASRWFNLASIISSTEGDVWIHREKDELWWTISRADNVTASLEPAPKPTKTGQQVWVLHKPTNVWSNRNKKGAALNWRALHPRAREFLFTEGTLQQLRPNNAAYALDLIEGSDLTAWHTDPAWKAKEQSARRSPATIFDAKQRAVARMAITARDTVAGAKGQQVLRTVKSKDLRFSTSREFEEHIEALVDSQDRLCAITGFPLQFDGEHDDPEFLCSLDRIDSSGHYELGNLQVVCRFINRWKNDGKDADFRRLIDIVRGA